MGKRTQTVVKPSRKEDAGREKKLRDAARALFDPPAKNPYYFNGKPLRNLQELADYLNAFAGHEGLWVAAWLEYLGDLSTAEAIRNDPDAFKRIVRERCEELKKFAE